MSKAFVIASGTEAAAAAALLGGTASVFPSVEAALGEAAQGHPDVVVLDLAVVTDDDRIPELARAVEAPLVVWAAADDEGRGLAALARGASDLAWKHEGPVGLARAVQRALARGSVGDPERLVEQLVQAQKMESLGRLTGGIAHDFNNLLGIILTHAGLATKALRDPAADTIRSDLDTIRSAAEEGRDLVASLLAFARRSRIQPRPVSLGEMLPTELSTYRRLFRDDLVVSVEVEPGLPDAVADPGSVRQILLILLSNAQDAMAHGGTVAIRVERLRIPDSGPVVDPNVPPGDYVVVRVSDNGPGMSQEVLNNAFDPLFTTKARDRGTGLGLPVALGLMRQHGGTIRAWSEPGKGTEVMFGFPAWRADADGPAAGAPPPSGPAQGREAPAIDPQDPAAPPRARVVVLAEDNQPLRRGGRRILESEGFQVVEAEDGTEALAALEERGGSVDLVISDLMMPGMGGAELYRHVAARYPTLPFLISSGHVDLAPEERDNLPDHVPYILKPWTAEALMGKIGEVLRGERS